MRDSSVGFKTDEMGNEDLRIVIRDDNIAIAGGRPRGTLYGVYTFLEDYLGVRFLTAKFTHVPKVISPHTVGPVDRSYHSPFSYRFYQKSEVIENPVFAVRRRQNDIWTSGSAARRSAACTCTIIFNSAAHRSRSTPSTGACTRASGNRFNRACLIRSCAERSLRT